MPTLSRCEWCADDPLYVAYHDNDWGVAVHDDRLLFEMLVLEGAQAGLSWLTVLRKRESYRAAFDNFDAAKIARYDARKKAALLTNPGIIRNRLKIESTVKNAKAVLSIRKEFGSLDTFLWHYVDGTPIQNTFRTMADIPPRTALSDQISKDLKARGCNFVGSTICYAFMQSVGIVNDHVVGCFRHAQLGG